MQNSIHGGLGVGEVSVNTNGLGGGGGGGMAAGAGAVSQFSKANSLRTSSKRSKLKKMIIKRIFTEDDAYAEGEYVKNVGGLGDYNADEFNTTTKKDDKRETWSGKFDVRKQTLDHIQVQSRVILISIMYLIIYIVLFVVPRLRSGSRRRVAIVSTEIKHSKGKKMILMLSFTFLFWFV